MSAFVLLLVPVVAFAAGGFTDVDDDSVFKTDIQWLADAGVTKGCNPPTNDRFCPGSNVTREQMSAFMHRLAVNKVVDAKTAVDADKLDGKDSTAFAASVHDHDADYLAKSGKATDADKLDGKDSTAFLGATDKAIDSDNLDGKNSSAFVQHGTIVTTVGGVAWLPYWAGPTSVTRSASHVEVTADGSMVLAIDAPVSFDGVEYGLGSIEVCLKMSSSGSPKLDSIGVYANDSNLNGTVLMFDTTDRTETDCYTYKVGRSLVQGGSAKMDFDGGGSVRIKGTTFTWTRSANN